MYIVKPRLYKYVTPPATGKFRVNVDGKSTIEPSESITQLIIDNQ